MPTRNHLGSEKHGEQRRYQTWWESGISVLKRELQKRIAQLVLFIVLSFLAYVAYSIGLNLPSRGRTPWQAYIILLLRLNWWPLLKFLIILAALGLLYFFLRKLIAKQKALVLDAAIKRDIGLVGFYPVSRYVSGGTVQIDLGMQQRAQQQIIAAVENAGDVDMILVSGYKIIGTIPTPGLLSQVLREKKGAEHRLMILDPEWRSPGLQERARRIDKTVDQYIQGLHEVLEHLALLKFAVKAPIRVWVYRETPTFQMFKTADTIWMQTAVSYRTEDSPLCGFEKSPYALYWPLELFWNRMWETWGGDERELDLKAFFPKPPDA